ncbi:SPARC-related modular calcium-binding protein 1-like isoform X1 [Amphibalanus amphitrite]|uniref:SPARC-related modular calcium-binding protein 1-like isoform X1 n=1 Tax=Amphibalanus amphitrite TaxID=1232801 RepID=UPI001C9252DB|nr:SPARC-related modular calcium-binding protein 1-like isoform X1 [Amphibalanus amphitrite]
MRPRGTHSAGARRRCGMTMPAVMLVMMAAILRVASAAPQLPIQADSEAAAPPRRCTPNCDEAQPRPVCGTDGVTYPSRCHLGLTACRGAAVQLQHIGNCVSSSTGDSACLRKRAEALEGHPGGSLPQNIYVPQCTAEGLYAEVQCHRGSGHCWCMDEFGRAVLGTAVQHAQPDCSGRTSRASTDVVAASKNGRTRKRRRRGCGSRDRTVFRADIMKMIKREYQRRKRNRNNRGRSGADSLGTLAAEWKFKRMDKDRDGKISRREIRRLRKKARRQLKPALCARRFYRYCDTNSDRYMSKQEWLICVGVKQDNISFRVFLALNEDRKPSPDAADPPDSTEARLEPLSTRDKMFKMLASTSDEKAADEQESDCETDRRQALDNQRMAELEGKLTNSFFIPECTPDHKYSRVQCHKTTGYCWCADPDTGESYPQQAPVKDSVPDCSAIRPSTKPRPKSRRGRGRLPKVCRSGAGLQSFLRLLMDHLTSRLIKALQQKKYILPRDTGGQRSFEEKVAEWKFSATDTNENKMLDRREWKTLRKEFSEDPELRRCGRRLPRYCDANNDRKIELDEWLVCVGAVEEERRPAKGPNPFEVYLTSSEQ